LAQSISQKIVRNTAYNAIGKIWGIGVALFLIPYIIGHIGVERFGIWAIVSVLTGYLGILDLGISASFVKYIAEYHTRKDHGRINQLVSTGVVFYGLFGLAVILLVFLLIQPLLRFFNVPGDLHREASFVFRLGTGLFAVTCALTAFDAVKNGLQRMDITNKVVMVMSIPNVAGTIFFLESGYGLPGLMINSAIVTALTGAVNVVIAYRILPTLKFNPFACNMAMFRVLLRFGYRLQISKIASLFHFQLDKILLAYFLNIGTVAYYSVAANVASKIRQIPLLLISAVLPAASELEADMKREKLCSLYFRTMKYMVLLGLPILFLTMGLARPFMDLWLGKGFEKSVLTLQILMMGYFFNILTGPGFTILNGMGKPQYGMRSSIFASAVNLILSVILIIKMGYYGAVIGTAVSMILAALYFIAMFHRVMAVSIWQLGVKILLVPVAACGASYLLLFYGLRQIERVGWFWLILLGLLYVLLFGVLILILGYLDEFDRSLANRYSPIRLFKSINKKKP
jgi:O-antigen/teichoic acid export membrane protein